MTVTIEQRRGGMRIVGSGGGGKGGGGSARTPVEQPDSLHNTAYAAVLDVIGNGEMTGPVHRDEPLRDIYLNGTPIQNADGSLNFRNVQAEYRVGTQDQEHIAGFPAAASVTSVGREVGITTPFTQLLTNPDLSAVRITLHWPQLMRMVDSGGNAGDRVGYRVEYAIDLAIGTGAFREVLRTAADGKTVNGYTRTHRIELPSTGHGWTVRVRRLSPEPNNSAIQSKMLIQSYAEVIDGKFRYPMTALVGIKVDAEQFQSIPTRAYHWRGQLIRVPSNYDPVGRTYSGSWDGTFKRAWSNNPAWVFYDILTNKLYGLGDRIDASMVDRYALYQIGAYCDQKVPDGQGGTEPRFTCNAYIQSAVDALRLVNDLASTFRGMTYWANGQAVAVADMPSDPVYTYPNSKVAGGVFNYTGADLSTVSTVALVSWNDPSDFYRAKVEVVQDEAGIRLFGIRKTEITAFGCSSRGQAQRVGLYNLYTSLMEQGGVSFAVGLEGVIPQPGSLVRIADANRSGRRNGGLISAATARVVTLDAEHSVKVGDRLTVNLPSGKAQTRTVSVVAGRKVTVSTAFGEVPATESSWSVDADDLVTQLVRVISVKDVGGITFEISGVFHHPDKFNAIDSGVRLEPLPVSVVPPRVQSAPTNVRIAEHHTVRQGVSRHTAEISWDAVEHATAYDVQWRRDSGDWVQVPRTGTRLVEIPDIYSGSYIVRVRSINALDVPSLWAYSEPTELSGRVGSPPAVAFLQAHPIPWGIRLNWGFPTGPNIFERTEIRYGASSEFAQSLPAGSFAYPTNQFEQTGLAITTRHFFWARLIDKNGTLGPWYPPETEPGIRGTPSQNAEDYTDLVTQDVVGSALGELIMSDIRQIPDIREGVDALGVDLNQLDQRVAEINAQVDELLGAAEWDAAQPYAVGTVVFAEGKMYRAKKAVPAETPVTSAEHWDLIGDYASISEGLIALAIQAQETLTRVEEAEGQITAVSEKTDTLASKVEDPENGLAALSLSVHQMRTQVTQLQDGLSTLSESTTQLSSKVGGLEDAQSALTNALDTLGTRVEQTEQGLTAESRRSTVLEARLLSDQDSDSLIPDYLMANPECWFSRYGHDLTDRFVMTETGKVASTVFRHSTGGSWNYSRTAIPTGTQYRVRFWARRSTDSDGSVHITMKNVRPNGTSSDADYGGVNVTPSVPADGQWHLVDRVILPSDTTFSRVHFGFATNHTSTKGWGEAQGFRVTGVAGAADINPSEVATARSVSSLSSTVSQIDGKVTSQSEAVALLSNTINDPATGLQATADALSQTNTKLEGTEKAVIDQKNVLQAGLRQIYEGEDAELEKALAVWESHAAIAETRQIVATEVTAMAEIVDIVRVSLGGDSAAVQETLQALVELEGKMIAQWGINVQLNVAGVPYAAGLSLGIVNEGGITRSALNVVADMFNVMHDVNGQPKAVFSVQGGAAIINTALIGTASIKSAHIESLDALKIESQNLAAVLANIGTAYIDSAHMKQGSVKRLHVGVAEIDTLRVAGRAITIVGQVFSPGQSLPNQATRDTVISMTLPVASDIVISVGHTPSVYDGADPQYRPTIRNDISGATLKTLWTAYQQPLYYQMVVSAPAGLNRFALRLRGVSGIQAGFLYPESTIKLEAYMR